MIQFIYTWLVTLNHSDRTLIKFQTNEVVLNAKSGMRVDEAANHVDPDADVIIMQASTNNLRDSTSEEVGEKVMKRFKKFKKKNPKLSSHIPLSSEEKALMPQMVCTLKLFKPIKV